MPDYIKNLVKKKKTEVIFPVKVLSQTEQQKKINQWMSDFDNIWIEQGSNGGKRFVFIEFPEVKSRKMDIAEYLQYRLDLENITKP